MSVLIIEPFYGGSHKALLDVLIPFIEEQYTVNLVRGSAKLYFCVTASIAEFASFIFLGYPVYHIPHGRFYSKFLNV